MAPSRSEQYKLVLLNVRGIKSKIKLNEIYNVVTEHDIIGLTETLSNAFDFENLKTHEVFSGNDKLKLKGFRGLALVVRKSLKYSFSETNLGLWVHVEIGGNNFSIGLYYAPCEGSKLWDVNFFDEIQVDVLQYKCKERNVIIMGDFNARTGENDDYVEIEGETNDICHRSDCDKLVNTNGRLLLDMCKTTEMSIVNGRVGDDKGIGAFTCHTHNGRSLIDYCLIDSLALSLIGNITVWPFDPCLSDVHCVIVMRISNTEVHTAPKKENVSTRIRKWNDKIKSSYNCDPHFNEMTDMDTLLDTELNTLQALNEINSQIVNVIKQSALQCGALRYVSGHTKAKSTSWFDRDCKLQRSIYRKKLRNALRRGDQDGRRSAFREYKRFLQKKRSAMSAKTNGFLRNMKSSDPKGYWSLLKSFTKSDVNIPIDKTTVFQHFKDLSSASNPNMPESHYFDAVEVNENINYSFSIDEIKRCLKKIKNGKSAGHDDIFPEFLKYAPEKLIVVITKFFNAILERGEVPDDWALSVYCPIFKKGDRKDVNNYRGISLANCLCKLFTSLITERMQKDLESRRVLGIEQAGFRENMGCTDHAFVLYTIVSFYLAQRKRLFVTFIDYEKAFDRVDHTLLWMKLASYTINGKVLSVIKNLYEKTKACVNVNGSLTDVFECRIGVRQGDNLSPLLFIVFMNDFQAFVSSRFNGLQPDALVQNVQSFLKLFVLLYADDTLLLTETESDMQKAVEATLQYCKQNRMCINTNKTKYMIFSRGKVRKTVPILADGKALERVDTFCYLGIVFRFNNTFQAAMKYNIDKAKKALFKMETLLGKVDLEVETKLHLFDTMILPILIYGCEVWGFEKTEQIEVFHRNFLRRVLRLRKSAPNGMIYGELGRQEIKFTIWQRMANFWKKVNKQQNSFSCLIFQWMNNSNQITSWHQGIRKILINCGIPFAENYSGYIADAEFKKYVKDRCNELAFQSWQVMVQNNSLCDNYRLYKHRLELETYLKLMKGSAKWRIIDFRCASLAHPKVMMRFHGLTVEECTLCGMPGTPDEYHLLFVCKKFENRRKDLLPGLYHSFPNVIKYDQLMNTNNIKLLKNLSVLCGAIHDMLLHTSDDTIFSS